MIDKADIESAEGLFKEVFRSTAADFNSLMTVIDQIVSDAIDMRTVFRSTEDSAVHLKTKKTIADTRDEYEHAMSALCNCGDHLRALIDQFQAADYSSRLDESRLRSPDEVSRAEQDRVLAAMFRVRAKMMRRHSEWSTIFINFASLIRGIDGAHVSLLARPSAFQKMKGLIKPALGEAAGSYVPGFGFLVELAKAQQPEVDKLIDLIDRASSVFDKMHAFGDLLAFQKILADFTMERIREAEVSEQEFAKSFEEAMPRRA